ncbi:hypothetical protein EII34_10795 [Arachnia propionica]|uniref:Uncharacterized protein n=1 Tax=Arachnia propionica TaxID=1750 RepID=A0A3P1T480_9ACTN|nr:hypothetical protein [Arachnia propionica]RRD04312.1 hypothetical protein EII34_10795 [Arachnia propionica]
MSWGPDEFLALVGGTGIDEAIRAVRQLSDDDRSAAATGLRRALPRLVEDIEPAVLMVVAAGIGASPAEVVPIIRTGLLGYLMDDPEHLDLVRDSFAALGPDWALELQRRLPGRDVDWFHVWLLDELILAHDLPLPTHPGFWREWHFGDVTPRPGRRWQEHFIAACAVPNGLGWRDTDASGFLARLREHMAVLRAAEPVDDEALLRALIEVIARGDARGPQRTALIWAEGLGLDQLFWERPDLWLPALPGADAAVVARVVERLPQLDLDDDQLTMLATEVLTRPQRTPKRAVVKALERVAAPSEQLLEVVAAAAHDVDATVASRAATLLERWGHAATTVRLGLWREPTGAVVATPVVPLTEPELWAELGDLLAESGEDDPLRHEQLLAGLVAVGWDQGREAVWTRLGELLETASEKVQEQELRWLILNDRHGTSNFDDDPDGEGCRQECCHPSILADQIISVRHEVHTGEFRMWVQRAPLSEFVGWRAREALEAIGRVPCLLSTPTHTGNRVCWQEFRQRVGRFVECGQPLLPTDLLVGLARIEGIGDWADLAEVPVGEQGVGVGEVLELWLQFHPPAELRFRDAVGTVTQAPRRGVEIEGDELRAADLVGNGSSWSRTFWPRPRVHGEHAAAMGFLPAHPSRPAVEVLTRLPEVGAATTTSHLELLLGSAFQCGPVTALAAVAAVDHVTPAHRDRIAGALLAAWDEGRLSPEDLAEPWRCGWADELRLGSHQRQVALLVALAEATGLALVWPSLVALAERVAAPERPPSSAGLILETLLRFLPEVAGHVTVDLPSVAALAGRKGSSKAIRTARLVANAVQMREETEES